MFVGIFFCYKCPEKRLKIDDSNVIMGGNGNAQDVVYITGKAVQNGNKSIRREEGHPHHAWAVELIKERMEIQGTKETME